jgi:hypothetical protein
MKNYQLAVLLLLLSSKGLAQTTVGSRWSVDVSGGAARVAEAFTVDCCGPMRKSMGSTFSLRAAHRVRAGVDLGAEAGATYALARDMKWLMPVVGFSRSGRRVTPWLQLGAGFVAQPGECPADGLDTDPACEVDLNLGAQLALGVRARLAKAWSLGGEVAHLRSAEARQRNFSSQRVAVTLRWH